jgi:putative FmdB family regulatory protein
MPKYRLAGGRPSPAGSAATIGLVPIYEFLCERCGGRFSELVEPGTEAVSCRSCGAERTRRVYSAQRAPFKVVRTSGEMRKQERRNAALRERAKIRFRARRRSGRRSPGQGP